MPPGGEAGRGEKCENIMLMESVHLEFLRMD